MTICFCNNFCRFFYIYKYDLYVQHKWTKSRHSPGIKILRGWVGPNKKLLNVTSFTIKSNKIIANKSNVMRDDYNCLNGRGKNLLVDRTKSIVKLIIFVLPFSEKYEFANSNVWVPEVSALSNNLWSILLRLFRSVQRSLLYKGQSRKNWITDSIPLPQLHIRLIDFWKLRLNLWLRPSQILVIHLIPIGLWQL